MEINAIEWISFIASLSTGFLLAYIRTWEPYFKYRINKTYKSLFGEIHEKDKNEKDFNNTYSAFLNSSLNIELVHIILKCITMNNQNAATIHTKWSNQFALIDTDFIEEKKINSIDEIEINLKQWQLFNTSTTKKKEDVINFLDTGEEQDDNIVCINEDIEVTILAEKVFA